MKVCSQPPVSMVIVLLIKCTLMEMSKLHWETLVSAYSRDFSNSVLRIQIMQSDACLSTIYTSKATVSLNTLYQREAMNAQIKEL